MVERQGNRNKGDRRSEELEKKRKKHVPMTKIENL